MYKMYLKLKFYVYISISLFAYLISEICFLGPYSEEK